MHSAMRRLARGRLPRPRDFAIPFRQKSTLQETFSPYKQQVPFTTKLSLRALSSTSVLQTTASVDSDLQSWIEMRDALARSNRVKYARASPFMGLDLRKSKEEREREVVLVLGEDWADLIETVSSLGSPEVADQLSGAYYMQGSPIEDYSAKTNRLSDTIPSFSKDQLVFLARQLSQKWNQSKVQGSGLLQLLVLNLDQVLAATDLLQKDDQIHLAILLGSFQFLEKLSFPEKVLRTLINNFDLKEAKIDDIVSVMLIATCCKSREFGSAEFGEIPSVIENKLIENFESLNPHELTVCFQGLQVLSQSSGQDLRAKMEALYGFRM